METSNIFDSLLEENQADLFEIFTKSPYNFFALVKNYMKSKVCRYIDGEFSRYHNASPKLIYAYLLKDYPNTLKKSKNDNVNVEAARWLGYFYRHWNKLTKEYSSRIVSQLPPKEGIESYFVLHQMNENQAIEICKRRYNLKRNAHRKYENKDFSLNISKIDEEYYLPLTKNLLIKLYGTQEYKSLELNYFRDSRYDLISKDKKIGIIFKSICKYSLNEVKNIFKFENEELMFSRFTAENSILFILVTEYIEELFFENELNKFTKFYLSIRNKFDNVFIYNNNALYQINRMYGLTRFNLDSTFSKVISQSKNL